MDTKYAGLFDKIISFLENTLAPPCIKISHIRYLQVLQNTFATMMPYILIGSTATLLLRVSEMMGLNIPIIQSSLKRMAVVCIQLMAVLCAMLNGFFLGEHYKKEDGQINSTVTSVLGIISFLCFIDFEVLSQCSDWPNYVLGAPSIFSAILISIFSTEIYRILTQKNMTIKMPEGVPPMVSEAFINLIPVCTVIVVSSLVGNFDFLEKINELGRHFVNGGSHVVIQFVSFLLDRIFWFVGLHGSDIVASVMEPIWTTMAIQNLADYQSGQEITYLFSTLWVDSYVRLSVFPIAVLCCISKVERLKVLGKLSIGGSIFNIAEPIMYGLPIVFNPFMFIPWVFGFGALFIFNAILTFLGLIPPIAISVVWTMPAPLMAFIGSGFNFTAFIISMINMIILFFIFLPFFKVMEKQELKAEEELMNR